MQTAVEKLALLKSVDSKNGFETQTSFEVCVLSPTDRRKIKLSVWVVIFLQIPDRRPQNVQQHRHPWP